MLVQPVEEADVSVPLPGLHGQCSDTHVQAFSLAVAKASYPRRHKSYGSSCLNPFSSLDSPSA